MQHQGNPLAIASAQLQVLAPGGRHPGFDEKLRQHEQSLTPTDIEILQVNVGKLCNMTCSHCHVDAGPDRREIMTRETIDACLKVVRDNPSIHTVDLTGGAPEMNPDFRYFVESLRAMGRHVIDRCNLTILLVNGYEDMAEFLAANDVEIVASLPCYLEENADAQRGDGSFQKSITALRKLNSLGYGVADSKRTLTLVYNPVGSGLPPNQLELETAYREQLRERYSVEFNRLFAITNMPISRFLDDLISSNQYDAYMDKLINAFNPAAVSGVMCRNTVSVSWDGDLFDCDFNQMLELNISGGMNIHTFDAEQLGQRRIITAQHCYGCTAGSGSGCQGAISG
ncbi:UNVERIFIED_CONTAM: hypothetical protein GTU68_004442 [Idotea baltica]|nr:hypothetical protein [Idotea baltica]